MYLKGLHPLDLVIHTIWAAFQEWNPRIGEEQKRSMCKKKNKKHSAEFTNRGWIINSEFLGFTELNQLKD